MANDNWDSDISARSAPTSTLAADRYNNRQDSRKNSGRGRGLDRSLSRLSEGKFVAAPKLNRQLLKDKVYKMATGQLGPSEAEKDQARAKISQQAHQQVGAGQREVARAALAGPRAAQGAMAAQQAALSGSAAKATAEANANVEAAAQQQQAAEANLVQQRLERQQERARENTRFAADQVKEHMKQAADVIADIYGGGM